jgi:hypothetical protein
LETLEKLLSASSSKGMKEIKVQQTVYSVQQLESMMKSEKDKKGNDFRINKGKGKLEKQVNLF